MEIQELSLLAFALNIMHNSIGGSDFETFDRIAAEI